MQVLKTLGFCFVVAAGCAMVYSAQTNNPSVPADFLVRSVEATDEAFKSQSEVMTLSDWEFTRVISCRGFAR